LTVSILKFILFTFWSLNIKKKKIIENFLNEKIDRIITFQSLKKTKIYVNRFIFPKEVQ